MSWRWIKFYFFFLLSMLTCLLMYLLLSGEPFTEASPATWDYPRLFDVVRFIDANPLVVIVFLSVIALAEIVTALMYLATPPEQRMIRYSTTDSEVLVNLDTIATSLQNTVAEEHDVSSIKVVLRVPSGKQLHIKCFIRLELMEQPDIPRRVEQLRERIRTHFEQALPLEAKFTSNIELKIVPSDRPFTRSEEPKQEEGHFSSEFQGPRYPVE